MWIGGIDHLVLVVSNIETTKNFYEVFLGPVEEAWDDRLLFLVGEVKLFLVLPYGKLPEGDKFSPNRIGLEHFAFRMESLDDLKDIEWKLNQWKIKHSEIHIDEHSQKEKIWLNDPDGIRIEFYLR